MGPIDAVPSRANNDDKLFLASDPMLRSRPCTEWFGVAVCFCAQDKGRIRVAQMRSATLCFSGGGRALAGMG